MTNFLRPTAPPAVLGQSPGMKADLTAVTACYREPLHCLRAAVMQRARVLVHCDGELVDYLVQALQTLLAEKRQPSYSVIDPFLIDPSFPRTFEKFVQRICECLPPPHQHWQETTTIPKELPVVILRHAGLLASYAGSNASALLFLQYLQGSPYQPVVGFVDPAVHETGRHAPLKLLESLFSIHVQITGIGQDTLSQALWPDAVQHLTNDAKFSTEDCQRLHQYVGDMNAIELRKALTTALHLRRSGSRQTSENLRYNEELLAQVRELAGKYPMQRPERVERQHIGGYEPIKEQLEENFILPYKLGHYDRMGRGILFHGPAGTGKTHFAKWLATELSAYLLMINGPEVKSKWHGESERLIRELFSRARDNQPAVIVMDEFDALGRARDLQPLSSGADVAIVNTLLAELGGLRGRDQIIFIATTNFLEAIDPALRNRLGRIEYTLHIDYPTRADARAILRINLEAGHICKPHHLTTWINTILPAEAAANDLYAACRQSATALTGDDLRILCERMDRMYHVAVALLKNRTEENRELCQRFLAKFTGKKKVTADEFCERIRDCVLQEFIEVKQQHVS